MIRVSIHGIILFILTILLLCIGWIALYSAAGNADEWANKQLFFGLYTILFSFLIAYLPTQYFFHISYYLWISSIVLLILAEVFGHTAMGAQRWLKFGFITIQPSEITKIGVILAIARSFANLNMLQIGKIRNLIIPLIIVFLPAVIILRQPNLGTSTIIILIAGMMFFIAGVKIWKFITVIVSAIVSMPVIWHFMHDYQKRRVMTFLYPEQDLLGDGYNIMQSKIAIGSGSVYGKGFLQGTQVQLNFLPEKHTDFIFTILAEEFGFYGVIILLSIYLYLIYTIYFIAFKSNNTYSKMICVGVASMIFLHLFINVGMVSGLLPVVGTPLPLLSYGRSNLVTTIVCMALVLNTDIYKNHSKLLK